MSGPRIEEINVSLSVSVVNTKRSLFVYLYSHITVATTMDFSYSAPNMHIRKFPESCIKSHEKKKKEKRKDKFAHRVRTSHYLLRIIPVEGVELLQSGLHAQDIPIRHPSQIHDGEGRNNRLERETRESVAPNREKRRQTQDEADEQQRRFFWRCYCFPLFFFFFFLFVTYHSATNIRRRCVNHAINQTNDRTCHFVGQKGNMRSPRCYSKTSLKKRTRTQTRPSRG